MRGACAGIRVLDCSTGAAGSLATMVLADFGAEVVRVDAPGADPASTIPGYLLLGRGKRSVELDIGDPSGRTALHRLVPGFDVVVQDCTPGAEVEAGLGWAELSALNPAAVVCSITGFGTAGRFAGVDADDWLVMAKAGIFRDQPGWEQDGKRPIFRSCPDGSYFAGMLGVLGILAALRARDLTGRGQHVETNMLQAISCRQNPQVRWLLRDGEELPLDRAASTEVVPDAINPLAHHRDPREVTLTGMLVECKDGRWIMHSLSEPHFFPAWIEAIGYGWIWEDDRFSGAPWRFPDDDAKVELVQRLQATMKERTSTEWIELYLANGNVCADVIQTTQDALSHPQVLAADDVIQLDDPRVGPMVQVGPLAKIPAAPAEIRSAAPDPGQHTAEVLEAPVEPVPVPVAKRDRLAGPLEGITVVEAGYYYATPFATALLAELGARVIKIEPINGDPYRLLGRGSGDPVAALGHNNMVRAMQGKESIALNLKDERGREVLHRLIGNAALFVHSFRGSVPHALGIDQETLATINPKLVYQYAASYGSMGPYAKQPAIDPVIAAFAGQTAYQTGEGNPPLRESGADPVAAAGHAVAMMLGIYAGHRSGQGLYVESAMIVSNLYLNYADAFSYDGKAPRPSVDAAQFGTGATHRLYQCEVEAGPERAGWENPAPQWVMLAADSNDAFVKLCTVANRSDLAADPRFSSGPGRVANRSALEEILVDVFSKRTAQDWESSLLAAGVGCVIADAMSNFAFLYRDQQAQAVGMMTTTEHPVLGGTYWRYSPVLTMSDTPTRVLPHCVLGEHAAALLTEAGYTADQIEELRSAGAVGPAAELAPTGA